MKSDSLRSPNQPWKEERRAVSIALEGLPVPRVPVRAARKSSVVRPGNQPEAARTTVLKSERGTVPRNLFRPAWKANDLRSVNQPWKAARAVVSIGTEGLTVPSLPVRSARKFPVVRAGNQPEAARTTVLKSERGTVPRNLFRPAWKTNDRRSANQPWKAEPPIVSRWVERSAVPSPPVHPAWKITPNPGIGSHFTVGAAERSFPDAGVGWANSMLSCPGVRKF
jgi:hypothetical protein